MTNLPRALKLCSNSCNSFILNNSTDLCLVCHIKSVNDKAKALGLGKDLEAEKKKVEQLLKLKEEADGVDSILCDSCHQKSWMTSIPCECGGKFCSLHYNREYHPCDYPWDWTALARN